MISVFCRPAGIRSLAALLSGGIELANRTPPTDSQAIARGYHYVVYGPDLKIPYAATAFVMKRSLLPSAAGCWPVYARHGNGESHAHG